MVQFKLNISEKTGKTLQKELSEEESIVLMNKTIGQKFSGDSIGFSGYEFEITGGSDVSGVPMRADNPGSARKRILTTPNTIGFRKGRDGIKRRILVAGNTITEQIVQVNAKVVKAGSKPLVEEPEPEAPAEDASTEKAESTDEKPSEEKSADEKPAEEKTDSEEKAE